MDDWIKAVAEEIAGEIAAEFDVDDENYVDSLHAIIAHHYNLSLRAERSRVEARIEQLRKEIEATIDEGQLDSLLDGLTELEAYHFHLPEPKEGTDE